MVGVPASPGVVTGLARVILDPTGAHLEPGEILVAPSTDPGWTPLFLTAGGLVMEMGGANSHGAVVAREYGIPAVVGTPLATERISTGDLVTVNGILGTVTVDSAGTEPSPTQQPVPSRPRRRSQAPSNTESESGPVAHDEGAGAIEHRFQTRSIAG
jgi:pyruvate,water dikinase